MTQGIVPVLVSPDQIDRVLLDGAEINTFVKAKYVEFDTIPVVKREPSVGEPEMIVMPFAARSGFEVGSLYLFGNAYSAYESRGFSGLYNAFATEVVAVYPDEASAQQVFSQLYRDMETLQKSSDESSGLVSYANGDRLLLTTTVNSLDPDLVRWGTGTQVPFDLREDHITPAVNSYSVARLWRNVVFEVRVRGLDNTAPAGEADSDVSPSGAANEITYAIMRKIHALPGQQSTS